MSTPLWRKIAFVGFGLILAVLSVVGVTNRYDLRKVPTKREVQRVQTRVETRVEKEASETEKVLAPKFEEAKARTDVTTAEMAALRTRVESLEAQVAALRTQLANGSPSPGGRTMVVSPSPFPVDVPEPTAPAPPSPRPIHHCVLDLRPVVCIGPRLD